LPFDQYTYPTDIEWSSDSTKLAVAYSNHVRIWAGGLDWTSSILEINDRFRFEQAMWSADANQLYTTYTNPAHAALKPKGILRFADVVQRWDIATGNSLEESPLLDQVFLTTNETQRLIISNVDKQLSVRDAETNHVLWSQTGTYFAGSVFNNQVQLLATVKSTISSRARITTFSIWDLVSNQNLSHMSGNYRPEGNFAPKGNVVETRLIPTGSDIWESTTGEKIMLPSIEDYTWTGAFWSPDGECAISMGNKTVDGLGHQMNSILLWRVDDPQNGHLLDEREDGYEGVVWSPDGKRLAVIERTEVFKNSEDLSYPNAPSGLSSRLVIWSNATEAD
jgi:hypothetical protein